MHTALRVEYGAARAHLADVAEVEHPEGDVYERDVSCADERLWNVSIARHSCTISPPHIHNSFTIVCHNPVQIQFL